MTEENNIPLKCLGISGAVNFKKPDESALEYTKKLENAIINLNIFEKIDETKKRREALYELQDFCNKWIYKKSLDQMYPESVAKTIKGKIFTFGSYRLGVNFSGADIDAVLVAPRFINREEFFDDFVNDLMENENAKDIHPVSNAYVPVLKMVFMDVEIDLLFAKVDQISIADTFSLTENSSQLLRNMDDRDVRSVNGVRVTDDILDLVYNKSSFRAVLKIIRIWAKRRCIYSNALGFLGGVSWAILVARICQLWPLATVSTLVYNFFKFYGCKWRWPMPVMLKEVEQNIQLNFTQWDPRINPADQNHVMPILTPSYPCQNSTYNVTESHKQFIIEQMQKGLEVLRQILVDNRPYEDLFKPLCFFTTKHYLVVKYRNGGDKKKFREETSFIESKLRILAASLETNSYVESAVIYLKPYDRQENVEKKEAEKNEEEKAEEENEEDSEVMETVRRYIIGMKLRKLDQNLSLIEEIKKFTRVLGEVEVDVDHFYRKNLKEFVPEEDKLMISAKIRQDCLERRKKEAVENQNQDVVASSQENKNDAVPESNSGETNTDVDKQGNDDSGKQGDGDINCLKRKGGICNGNNEEEEGVERKKSRKDECVDVENTPTSV